MYDSSDPQHVAASDGKKAAKKLGAFSHLRCSALEYGRTDGKTGKVDKVFRAAIKCGLIRKKELEPPGCGCTLL